MLLWNPICFIFLLGIICLSLGWSSMKASVSPLLTTYSRTVCASEWLDTWSLKDEQRCDHLKGLWGQSPGQQVR
jgi:hypothetical protein